MRRFDERGRLVDWALKGIFWNSPFEPCIERVVELKLV